MKTANIFKLVLIAGISTSLVQAVFATDLDSTSYKIVGATTSSGGGLLDSASGNYSLMNSVGEISADPRNYSTHYRLQQDPSASFLAAQPSIRCFETTTNGSSNCTSGPAELISGGMTALCGTGGCYDKARFEISTNPYKYSTSTSGLVGYWPLDEGVNDSCLDGEDSCDRVSTNNGIASGTTIIDGIYQKARSFNGVADYIDVGKATALDLSSQGTISAWVKTTRDYPSDTTSYKYRGIVTKSSGGGATTLSYWLDWFGTNSTRMLRFGISNGTSTNIVQVNNFDFGDDWVHIVGIFDGSYLKLYANGQYLNQTAQTVNAQYLDYQVTIGRAFGNSAYTWEGDIDEVSIFNRAISESEITDMWQSDSSENTNPSDTLYTIAISTDNFVNDVQYIDGTTFRPEAIGNHDINDFRTQAYWEAEVFNIKGLQSNTLYYIMISALQGDFTQSDYSKTSSTTTSIGAIYFDIDIANSTGITTETSSPYTIAFSGANNLIAGAAASAAPDLVWLDIESNSSGGVAVVQFGKNGGLYSSTTSQTISSTTADLDTTSGGFGLQSFYIDNDTSAYLGDLTAATNYAGTLNSVGAVSTTVNKVYDGDGPISNGRVGMYLIAKADSNKTPATDYSEEIYFVLVPRY